MTNNLKPGERLDDLQIKGYEIIQSPGRFCFGMDAVFLSAFAKVKAGECVLDLGTGTGILPILFARKDKRKAFYRTGDPGRKCGYGVSECPAQPGLRSRSTL